MGRPPSSQPVSPANQSALSNRYVGVASQLESSSARPAADSDPIELKRPKHILAICGGRLNSSTPGQLRSFAATSAVRSRSVSTGTAAQRTPRAEPVSMRKHGAQPQ